MTDKRLNEIKKLIGNNCEWNDYCIAGELLAIIQEQKDRLKMYKDCRCIPTGEITYDYISEFLRSLPTGSIWYFIACKWDAMRLKLSDFESKLQDEKNSRERLMGQNAGLAKTYTDAKQRAEQAEAQNKLMRELLVEIQSYAETYVDLNPRMKHIIDCAKAALEDKP